MPHRNQLLRHDLPIKLKCSICGYPPATRRDGFKQCPEHPQALLTIDFVGMLIEQRNADDNNARLEAVQSKYYGPSKWK